MVGHPPAAASRHVLIMAEEHQSTRYTMAAALTTSVLEGVFSALPALKMCSSRRVRLIYRPCVLMDRTASSCLLTVSEVTHLKLSRRNMCASTSGSARNRVDDRMRRASSRSRRMVGERPCSVFRLNYPHWYSTIRANASSHRSRNGRNQAVPDQTHGGGYSSDCETDCCHARHVLPAPQPSRPVVTSVNTRGPRRATWWCFMPIGEFFVRCSRIVWATHPCGRRWINRAACGAADLRRNPACIQRSCAVGEFSRRWLLDSTCRQTTARPFRSPKRVKVRTYPFVIETGRDAFQGPYVAETFQVPRRRQLRTRRT